MLEAKPSQCKTQKLPSITRFARSSINHTSQSNLGSTEVRPRSLARVRHVLRHLLVLLHPIFGQSHHHLSSGFPYCLYCTSTYNRCSTLSHVSIQLERRHGTFSIHAVPTADMLVQYYEASRPSCDGITSLYPYSTRQYAFISRFYFYQRQWCME